MLHQNIALVTLLAVVALLGLAHAQVSNSGCCPTDIQVVPNFNVAKYMGLWYEQQKYPFFQEQGGKCITAQYTLNADNSVHVLNQQINTSNNYTYSVNGKATVADNAKLIVNFPTGTNNTVRSNYWVLDTDYSTYSVVYSCYQTGASTYNTNVWILSRDRTPANTVITKARSVLTSQNINLTPLTITDQTNCSA